MRPEPAIWAGGSDQLIMPTDSVTASHRSGIVCMWVSIVVRSGCGGSRVGTVTFPGSPRGGHAAWLWEVAQGAELTPQDLDEHFTELGRSIPMFRNVATLAGFARNGFMSGAELRRVVEVDDDRIVVFITTPSGLELQASVLCAPNDGR